MKKTSKNLFSTTHIILISFLLAILLGTLLLALPISSSNGNSVGFTDALFTATTSVCVTGLVTLTTVTAWSAFGQAVILILIQIGGLGIITVMAGIVFAVKKKMGISDSILIQDAFNLNSLSGLRVFLKNVLIGTFSVEAVGALLYMTVFIPEFGARGVWISVFTSVSAFCNAGIDIIAEDSLASYVSHPMINFVTCALIILGGIGYIVWWDIIGTLKKKKKRFWRSLTLHTKIALVSTLFWIVLGASLILLFEYNNPNTIGDMSLPNKLQASLFQSITTRTAGFFTVPQENLSDASALISLVMMFIGGSPVGTAGGIKTVTFTVLAAAAISAIKNRESVTLFGRTLPKSAVRKAIGVCFASFTTAVTASLILLAVSGAPFLDVLYETVSATATVGLSRALTPTLNTLGKLVITATMYFGRVGPISLAIAFGFKNEDRNLIKTPVENVNVG